jgi:hypothetical protein
MAPAQVMRQVLLRSPQSSSLRRLLVRPRVVVRQMTASV